MVQLVVSLVTGYKYAEQVASPLARTSQTKLMAVSEHHDAGVKVVRRGLVKAMSTGLDSQHNPHMRVVR